MPACGPSARRSRESSRSSSEGAVTVSQPNRRSLIPSLSSSRAGPLTRRLAIGSPGCGTRGERVSAFVSRVTVSLSMSRSDRDGATGSKHHRHVWWRDPNRLSSQPGDSRRGQRANHHVRMNRTIDANCDPSAPPRRSGPKSAGPCPPRCERSRQSPAEARRDAGSDLTRVASTIDGASSGAPTSEAACSRVTRESDVFEKHTDCASMS